MLGDAGARTESGQHPTTMNYVAVRLPPFWHKNPSIWFIQAETQFRLSGISSELTMYRHIVAALPPEIAIEVADALQAPPQENPFTNLKTAILDCTTLTERKRLQQLLNAEELGDRRPSQLLRSMESLLGDRAPTFDAHLLRELFLQRLPPQAQMILAAASSLPTDDLAQQADKIMEVVGPGVASHSQPSSDPSESRCDADRCRHDPVHARLDSLSADISHLRECIDALSADRTTRRQHSPHRRRFRGQTSRTRRRSSSPRSEDSSVPWCWYHHRFGARAEKCTLPCGWSGNPAGEH
ncbi:uncharacterized protein LOC135384802 [Ornithodoros turicata]|uniref:uncharacterized protein LOC135384802 n=1 Tax=Ornithodoros turicata TaxID=34597 RepID=UPI003138C7C6